MRGEQIHALLARSFDSDEFGITCMSYVIAFVAKRLYHSVIVVLLTRIRRKRITCV